MIQTTDVASLSIYLNELRSNFDREMREGQNFSRVKIIYMRIKEAECHLKALEWDPDQHAGYQVQGTQIDDFQTDIKY